MATKLSAIKRFRREDSGGTLRFAKKVDLGPRIAIFIQLTSLSEWTLLGLSGKVALDGPAGLGAGWGGRAGGLWS